MKKTKTKTTRSRPSKRPRTRPKARPVARRHAPASRASTTKAKPAPPPAAAPSTHPHVTAALDYCAAVIAGQIPACKWTRLACQRHLDDLARSAQASPDFPYDFNPAKAERVCRFIEVLPHTKGKWARRDPLAKRAPTLRLEPWQCFAVISIFGWLLRGTMHRRFKEADIWVARKNGKSPLAAGIGHWMFAKDNEPGAEVYCGASTEKQAWEVFGPAHQMCKVEPRLQTDLGITVNAKSLHRFTAGSLSKFEPVIGKPGDGASPHCAIIDEYHEHPTSEQFDTFKTGMVAREQPLLLVISTAGFNISGPAHDRWREGQQIVERTITDERRFVLMYTTDTLDEWTTEIGLRKANPNWGVSVNALTVLGDQQEAMREARKQTAFKTKHLNLWVTAATAYYNLEHWRACLSPTPIKPADFPGQPCYIGGDLASKVNLAAVALVFPRPEGKFALFCRYYAPHATVHLPENQHFAKWAREGWLTVTPGNIIDFSEIRDDILGDCAQHEVREIPLDPWQAVMLINELSAQGAPAYELRQTVQFLSEPTKQLDALMRSGKIIHDGNPVTAWCISNVNAYEDKKGNVYPHKDKPNSPNFIDGAMATLMALSRALINPGPAATPGLIVI